MATDPNPALRAELLAALAVLAPEIRGLHKIANDLPDDAALAAINGQITARERRRDLEQKVINALDTVVGALEALLADGYPNLPAVVVPPDVFDEIAAEESDIEAAVAIFVEQPVATGGTITFPAPTTKP